MSVVIWTIEQARNVARARRGVYQGAERLAAQQRRLKTLRAAGRDTTDAENLLHACEDSQLLRFARLLRLENGTRVRAGADTKRPHANKEPLSQVR